MAEENPPENHYEEGFESLIFQSQTTLWIRSRRATQASIRSNGLWMDTLNPRSCFFYIQERVDSPTLVQFRATSTRRQRQQSTSSSAYICAATCYLAVFVELGRHLSFYYLRFPLFEDFKDEIAWKGLCDGTLQFPLEAVSREVSDDPQAKALQPVYRLLSRSSDWRDYSSIKCLSRPTADPTDLAHDTRANVAILDATHMLDCDAEDFMLGVNIFNPHPDIVNQNSAMGIGIAAFRTLEIFSGFLDTLESDPSSDRKFTQYWRDWFGGWSNSLGVAADRYRAALTAAVTSIQT
ncbi:hypothetical protein KEM48_001390 [Puccinia striiformis f. sp. tritici PST-130]|nr:hypothetical protein KEM48_001390 [Puccinia striiformis f. sp. tritici PST-130]